MLQKAAYCYLALCSYRIHYRLGKKDKTKCLEIAFPEYAFHHLAGYHYMTRDTRFVSKSKALNNARARQITAVDFKSSDKYEMIVSRWHSIALLEEAIRNTRHVMEYVKGKGPSGSNIRARFSISYSKDENIHYYFFDGETDNELVPVSCLVENAQPYHMGCKRWTVLKIEKQRKDIPNLEIVYCADSYRSDGEI